MTTLAVKVCRGDVKGLLRPDHERELSLFLAAGALRLPCWKAPQSSRVKRPRAAALQLCEQRRGWRCLASPQLLQCPASPRFFQLQSATDYGQ